MDWGTVQQDSFKRYRDMWTTSDLSYNVVFVLSHFMNLSQSRVGIHSVTLACHHGLLREDRTKHAPIAERR